MNVKKELDRLSNLFNNGYYDDVISHFPKSAKKWNFIDKLILNN